MSNSRSDSSDPLRPADHADSRESAPTQPALGVVGWLRWGWRQLTSMRTAIVLLLLLAIAAIPGSIVPQRSADPNGVVQFRQNNPELYPVYEFLQLFDVYSSIWFSAIYILLFISLIGCVIPRTKHHFKALKARPPRTPARLSRLDDHREETLTGVDDAAASAVAAVDLAEGHLKKLGYRVERYDKGGVASVSAERGYLRETGNLVFHVALIGVLISAGLGGGLTYTGQAVFQKGESFVNSLGLGYNTFNPGRFVDTEALPPYTMTLDDFHVDYVPLGEKNAGHAGNYAADVTIQKPGEEPYEDTIRVNHPITVEGERVYLMTNGYAPTITVRDPEGEIVFRETVNFLPQDERMTSLGFVKVTDGLADQVGLVGFMYPTAYEGHDGAYTSMYPDLLSPMLSFQVYKGDLGIDDGTPRSVYALDTTGMTQLAGREDALKIELGKTVDLPEGLGTVTFENETELSGAEEPVTRYIGVSVHRDPGAGWVLVFAILAIAGLLAGLFVPRRRMWVKATPDGDTVRMEYAGLARGEDPAIAIAVDDLAAAHAKALAGAGLSGAVSALSAR